MRPMLCSHSMMVAKSLPDTSCEAVMHGKRGTAHKAKKKTRTATEDELHPLGAFLRSMLFAGRGQCFEESTGRG